MSDSPEAASPKRGAGALKDLKLHEKINTAGVVLSLALSTVTAWAQFGPAADNLSILEVDGHSPHEGKAYNKVVLGEKLKNTETHSAVDFVTRFSVFNIGDKSAAITSISLNFSRRGTHFFNVIKDKEGKDLHLPINISGREAMEFSLDSLAPILPPTAAELNCAGENASSWKLSICYAKGGRDFYGNEAQHDTTHGQPGIIVWPQHKEQWRPAAVLTITTADGTSISKTFKLRA